MKNHTKTINTNRLKNKIIGRITVILLWGVLSQATAQDIYTQYCNTRYGFCIDRPINFGMDPAPDNNDGRRFYDGEGFSVSVFGSYNALEHSLKGEMLEQEDGFDTITYRKIKNNWYVLSGYKDDNIVYIKTFMGRDGEKFYHLYIIYPIALKAQYNEIVSRLSKSFHPSI